MQANMHRKMVESLYRRDIGFIAKWKKCEVGSIPILKSAVYV